MRLSPAFLAFVASLGSLSVSALAPPQRLQASTLVRNAAAPQFFSRNSAKLFLSDVSEEEPVLTGDDWKMVKSLYDKASSGDESLDQVILEALPTINPQLIMKLRGAVQDSREEFQAVSNSLGSVLDARMNGARDILTELMNAGEIRKLDSLIGSAARDGKLDVAFFQVLNMNLQDASAKQPSDADEKTANRFQILQHVYTRCQEEVEKTIPPGVALLNKVLRTEVDSIRTNQLHHYLCPQSNTIKTPDGKELELKGREKILVPHDEFVDAMANAVKQIRSVELAGGANRVMTASMVESCRQIAKEARVVIGEHFGGDSDEVKDFEEGLQPVFRPTSPESPFMTGIESD